MYVDFAVWLARVVNKPCRVTGNVAVDHGVAARPKKVLALVLPFLLRCCGAAFVFNNAGAAGDGAHGKHPTPRARAPYAEVKVARDKLSFFH